MTIFEILVLDRTFNNLKDKPLNLKSQDKYLPQIDSFPNSFEIFI